MHRSANIKKLRDHIIRLQELVQELPAGSVQEVADDLRTAMKVRASVYGICTFS
jgi:hypothetical protein